MTRGFTLIELIVAVAIIAILAGILVPITYRSLETAEEEATRQKMQLLKQALVGNPELIQNGIRTDFGFAGDMGCLPRDSDNPSFAGERTLSDDLYNTSSAKQFYRNWNGPYIVETVSGDSIRDSWGRELIYNTIPTTDPQGRNVVATLRSAGLDGRLDLPADDIVMMIYEDEFKPADSLRATANFSFRNRSTSQLARSCAVKLEAIYNDNDPAEHSGTKSLTLACKSFPVNISAGSILPVTVPFDIRLDAVRQGFRLPVGRLEIRPYLNQADGTCNGAFIELNPADVKLYVYVHDRMKTIPVNLPVISWTF